MNLPVYSEFFSVSQLKPLVEIKCEPIRYYIMRALISILRCNLFLLEFIFPNIVE